MKFINCLIVATSSTVLPLPGVADTPSSISEPAPAASLAQSGQTNAAIPWNQIGAKAGADYQGAGLAAMPTGRGARHWRSVRLSVASDGRNYTFASSAAPASRTDRIRINHSSS